MEELGAQLPLWSVLPFALLLLSIAIVPLIAPHFWESNRNKGLLAALLAVPTALYLVLGYGHAGVHELLLRAEEFTSFILLLASLFVITGGIVISGSLAGTPLVNTLLLWIGAVLASFIGTTGASVLLVRPLLRANGPRERKAHVVVFFIFVVSNCGGLLTPLGDPPLFMGFLKGVPFEWTFALWREWLFVNGCLLLLFHFWDRAVLTREDRERPGSQLAEVKQHERLRVRGTLNFAFLLGVIAVIYASGRGLGNDGGAWPFGVQELSMLVIALVAYLSTEHANREHNQFTFAPIVEVAVLFAGIFTTMAPALLLLNAHAESLGIVEPWQFFWATGLLSSFLDNTPAYLTFVATACGLGGIDLEGRYLARFLELGADASAVLAAISCGAVFMGANTYIGNGPNFMVKSIAEEWGVRMPSFLGYMLYASAILLPILVLTTLLFHRS